MADKFTTGAGVAQQAPPSIPPREELLALVERAQEANEHLSQAMLDATYTVEEKVFGGLIASRTMVRCSYNDLRIILGFADEAATALTSLIEVQRTLLEGQTARENSLRQCIGIIEEGVSVDISPQEFRDAHPEDKDFIRRTTKVLQIAHLLTGDRHDG